MVFGVPWNLLEKNFEIQFMKHLMAKLEKSGFGSEGGWGLTLILEYFSASFETHRFHVLFVACCWSTKVVFAAGTTVLHGSMHMQLRKYHAGVLYMASTFLAEASLS